jgi:anti-sigma regulatory factor (Ser/Thr protein kinase)
VAGTEPGETEEDGVRLRVPAEPASLGTVRARLRAWLGDLGADTGVAADVVLAVNEACANAIEHPVGRRHPWIDLVAGRTGGSLVVSVEDFGRWREREGARREQGGRGLGLMRALMDRVVVEPSPHGTTVRLERRVD